MFPKVSLHFAAAAVRAKTTGMTQIYKFARGSKIPLVLKLSRGTLPA
jgi:hypothetical protein